MTETFSFPAELPNPPFFGRQPFKHTLKPMGASGFDDTYEMNTQSGSQWDGFRHVSGLSRSQWTQFFFLQVLTLPTRSVLHMKVRMYGTMA
jgi:hypothetical protein